MTLPPEYLVLGPLLIALIFLLAGYAMGRNSAERPLNASSPAAVSDEQGIDDDYGGYFEDELVDPNDPEGMGTGRIPTMRGVG